MLSRYEYEEEEYVNEDNMFTRRDQDANNSYNQPPPGEKYFLYTCFVKVCDFKYQIYKLELLIKRQNFMYISVQGFFL